MWEIYTRQELWPDVKLSYQIQERVRAGQRMPLPPGGELNETIVRCWSTDSSLRPPFVQVYQAIAQVKEALPPPPRRDKDDYNDFVYPGPAQPRLSQTISSDLSTPSAKVLAIFDTTVRWKKNNLDK
jgi:hypothetical protein